MKVAAAPDRAHNPLDETDWVSCLRENFTSSSYGEGLETDRNTTQVPRQSLTRQIFFRFIKQHLRIKSFYGTSENAVKTQIWIAVSVYVLVAIVRKRSRVQASFYQILQILSLTLFEKMPILRALEAADSENKSPDNANQLILFHF